MDEIYSDGFERLINYAAKRDERTDEFWMELIRDEEYYTLIDFFDETHYNHYDQYNEYIEFDTQKVLKKIIRGKDAVHLIRTAFDMGRLVGRAAHILEGES